MHKNTGELDTRTRLRAQICIVATGKQKIYYVNMPFHRRRMQGCRAILCVCVCVCVCVFGRVRLQ